MSDEQPCGLKPPYGFAARDRLVCVRTGDHERHEAANGIWWLYYHDEPPKPRHDHGAMANEWMHISESKTRWHAIADRRPPRQMKVYFDLHDWWVGYYRGDEHHYVCPLPTLVIRWTRR